MSEHLGEAGEVLLRAGVPVGAALAGALLGALGSGRGPRGMLLLVHFAAGAFLGIALLYLLPEAARSAGWPSALTAALVGLALCAWLGTRGGPACPACDPGHGPVVDARVTTPLLLVVALHSILDGLALGEGPGGHHAHEALSFAVLAHKLPEGLAVAALCRADGRSPGAAFGLTAAIEAPTFLGALAAALLGHVSEGLLGLALAAVAGSFLYLALMTLQGSHRTSRPTAHTWITASGAVMILAMRLVLG